MNIQEIEVNVTVLRERDTPKGKLVVYLHDHGKKKTFTVELGGMLLVSTRAVERAMLHYRRTAVKALVGDVL